jgi:hypothetical protein
MQETPQYEKIFEELIKLSGCSKEKFTELYQSVRSICNVEDEKERVHFQSQFVYYIKTIIRKLPEYYSTLRELIDADQYLPVVKDDLLNYLDHHYGPENIHRIVIDFDDRETLKLAIQKMYDNVFDLTKLSMLLDFDDYGVNYFYEVKQADGSVVISDSDVKTEQTIFDALVADEELRAEVLKYIDLINAVHYTMGSEGDIRFDDQRILFESPIKALLKLSPEYIPLLIECYAVYNKWHDVSALSIGYKLLPSLYPDADEMIYLYASGYGRAMANYEFVDTFENIICEKLEEKEFRSRFVKLLAEDHVASGIGMDYEYGRLKGDDLREEIEISDWEEGFTDSRIDTTLQEVCSEEEYVELVEMYDETVEDLIDGDEEASIRMVPCDLSEINGIQLQDDGRVKRERTPYASIVYDTDQAGFITFEGKDYLLTCDEGLIRVVDFVKKTQFTVRNLSTDETTVSELVTTSHIQNNSPVHFVTLSEGVIQGWHLGSGQDTFRIRANASHLFLTDDGHKLAVVIGGDDDDDFEDNGDVFNIDLSQEKHGTVIYFELDSLSEISRWSIPFSDFSNPVLTRDGKSFFVLNYGNSSSVVEFDPYTGKQLKSHQNLGDYGTCLDLVVTPDSQKLIVDKNVYNLPNMDFYTRIGNFDFGSAFVSEDSNTIAICGDSASTEDSFGFSDLNTGKYLGRLNYAEDTYRPEIVFFSPCGKYFCAIVNGDLTLWNLKDVFENTPEEERETFEIDFPSVPVSMIVGGRIVSVTQAKGNFINEYKNPRFTLLEHGVFDTETIPAIPCEGREKVKYLEANLIEETDTLIPEVGKTIGVKLLATPQGRQQYFDVKVRISFPERIDSGESISSVEWYQQINAKEPVFIGWEFQNEVELKPGTWTIEVSNMEDTDYLFRRLFFIKKEFQAVDYSLKNTFFGLYSDDELPGDKLSESRTIVGKPGISFGLKFEFDCPDLEDGYTLRGEIEHPPLFDKWKGEVTTLSKRKFVLRHGNGIGFFRKFQTEDEVTEGKWIFRLIDPGLGTVLKEEELEIISSEDAGESQFELIDSGIYSTSEKVSLYKNYPQANQLDLVAEQDTIVLEEGMVFGFRYKFNNLMSGKVLAAMVYHPPIKSFFGVDTEEDFLFNVKSSDPQFIGWVMEREKYLVEGDWTIKVWEDEVNEAEVPIFEKTFQLTK